MPPQYRYPDENTHSTLTKATLQIKITKLN